MDDILGFDGEHRWLSNFFPSEVEYDGVKYTSVENAYQAAKVGPEHRDKFLDITPGQAKRLGRKLPMVPDWESKKNRVMYELLQQKFCYHESFRESLLATGDAHIEETNTWGDTYWGVCDGEGQNVLGRMIMIIRTFMGTSGQDIVDASAELTDLLCPPKLSFSS